ncbi:hypothetical protein [Novosphingobium sp.]|uniref:hypothetical protein n=1 Tax=Novosphingobium sp. TaxID=1874826 RepID=UPI0025E77CDB|nr:hypothetical protein [Novosphingobium sp.]
MAALLFSLLAVVIVGLGARDQMTLAAMTARQGQRPALLIAAVLTGAASIAVAVWASLLIAQAIPAPARQLFAVMALGLAGLEMLVLRRAGQPLEPTNSLGAFVVVMLAQQLTDATRFVVMALAVATLAPIPTALGGAAAAMALAIAGWLAAEWLVAHDLTRVRRVTGAAILAGAAALAAGVLSAI